MFARTLGGILTLFAASLPAAVIFDNTYTWNDPDISQFNAVSVRVTVSDSLQGNPQKEFWSYSVTNLDFLLSPARGANPVGIQYFDVLFGALPPPFFPQIAYSLGDFSQPLGWSNGSCGPILCIDGIVWAIHGSSLLPGESATFSFTLNSANSRPPGVPNAPNTIVSSIGNAAVFDAIGIFGLSGPLAAPGPPVPEPSTGLLALIGVLGLALWTRK